MKSLDKQIKSSENTISKKVNPLKLVVLVLFFGIFIGTAVAFATNIFVLSIIYLTSLRQGSIFPQITLFGDTYSIAPIVTLLIAAITINLIKKYFSIKRFHGPADSIYGAHRTDNEIDIKTGYLSTLAALISAGGGASVGQYGPLVHFGSTLGTSMRLLSKNALSTDIFIGCGAAAAISAGFNAPLAGLIFAHEALLRHFSIKAVTPIAIASFTAAAVSERFFGSKQVIKISLESPDLVQFLPLAILGGIFFGVIALVYMQALTVAPKLANRTNIHPSRLIFVAAIICGLIGIIYPEVLGIGSDSINSMLNYEFSLFFLLKLLLLKLLVTALCLSCGFFGGVFSPALFIGAAAGALLAEALNILNFSNDISALAICGMASVGASVIGTPIAGAIIVMELSANYDLGLLSVVSIASATLITYLFFGQSLFDRQLLGRGIDISLGRSHLKLMDESVGSIASQEFLQFYPDSSPTNVIKKMLEEEVTEAYIIDKNKQYRGKIRIIDLLSNSNSKTCFENVQNDEIKLQKTYSILQSIEICKTFIGESIPIINPKNNELVGIISEADLFLAYLNLNKQIRDLESG